MPFQFNARQYQPATADGSNPPLPVGEHPFEITGASLTPNKSGTGGYLQLDVVIFDGPSKGHAGAYRFNLFHENQTTVDIANRQLSSLCHVVGVFDLDESNLSQLRGKRFIGVVKPNPSDKYPNQTQIGGVKDLQGNDPGKTAAQPAQTAPPPQATPAAPSVQQTPTAAPSAPPAAQWGAPAAASAPAPAPAAWSPSPAAQAAVPPWASK